jgi:hypothetical protein
VERLARSVRYNVAVPLRSVLTITAGDGTVVGYRDASVFTGPDSTVGPNSNVVIPHPAPRKYVIEAHGDNGTIDIVPDTAAVVPS